MLNATIDDDSKTAHVVEAKRNLHKTRKPEERAKFYQKVSAFAAFSNHKVCCYFAGIEDGKDIVIEQDKTGKRFIL